MDTTSTRTERTSRMMKADASDILAELAKWPLEKSPCQYDACSGDGLIWSVEERRIISRCECHAEQQAMRLAEWKKTETRKLIQLLKSEAKVDLTKTIIKPWYSDIPRSGVWFWRLTGSGKSWAMGWALARQIAEAEKPFTWAWVFFKDLLDAWYHKNDADLKYQYEARNYLDSLRGVDALCIDEIDKIGNMTATREAEWFATIFKLAARGGVLRVASQFPQVQFLNEMKNELAVKERDGIGAQERRFYEMCKELEVKE